MAVDADVERITARAREIADHEAARLLERTPGSARLFDHFDEARRGC